MPADRPLLEAGVDALEVEFSRRSEDIEQLRELLAELEYRTKPRARALREKVIARLVEYATSRSGAPRIGAAKSLASHVAENPGTPSKSVPATLPTSSFSAPMNSESLKGLGWKFDDVQQAIVGAECDARLIVNAPPGTGKTAVACGRIAHLLDGGVPPHQIWLLSFTRTAVLELRNRIALLSERQSSVYAVKVATLDSRAWTLVQGFDGTKLEERFGGHDATVEHALAILSSNDEAVLDAIGEVSHLIVDEAQDLVGVRAEFVLELIRQLPKGSGVTVLTDDAQAIYGFAEEDESPYESGTLPERLRALKDTGFRETELPTVYRTSSPTLAELYVTGRKRILDSVEQGGGGAIRVVRECLSRWNDGDAESAQHRVPDSDTLQLYRTRLEVLDASCWLGSQATPHRIRMSGMPVVVHPWVGLALADFDEDDLTREELSSRWNRVTRALGALAPDFDRCWADLLRATDGKRQVRMLDLRRLLSRPRPLLEFVTPELGLGGPVLGTIHASKGREANHVELMLPPERDDEQNPEEEARVLFVGGTRAKNSLKLGKGTRRGSTPLWHGRRYSRLSPIGSTPRIRLEIGLDADVDPYSSVSAAFLRDVDDALAAQTELRMSIMAIPKVRAWRHGASMNLRFVLRNGEEENGQILGALSSNLTRSVYEVRKVLSEASNLAVPQYIGPLFRLSVATIVRDVEDPELDNVHEPWRSSGIWLAPVVTGLPTVPFFRKKNGH